MAGTIRKRGNSYQILLSFTDPETHKTVQFSATRRTKAEADRALAELVIRRDERKLVRSGTTFRQLVERHLAHIEDIGQLTPSTVIKHRSQLREGGRIMRAFGDMKLVDITPYHIDRFLADNADLTSNTRIACVTLIGSLFKRAEKWRLHPGPSPTLNADRLKRPDTRIELISEAEGQRLLECADAHSPFMGAVVRVAIATGMRHGELAALKWSDVNWDKRLIAVERTVKGQRKESDDRSVGPVKNGKPRTFGVSKTVMEVLRNWRVEQGGGEFVFAGPGGNATSSYHAITDRWGEVRLMAGLKRVRLHDLRHLNATMSLNAGHAPQVVAGRLGNNPAVLLSTYAHVTRDADMDAAEVMDEWLK